MKFYAFFNQDNICEGTISTSDVNMIIPKEYEEINAEEIRIIRGSKNPCKKIVDENGQRKIIPVIQK